MKNVLNAKKGCKEYSKKWNDIPRNRLTQCHKVVKFPWVKLYFQHTTSNGILSWGNIVFNQVQALFFPPASSYQNNKRILFWLDELILRFMWKSKQWKVVWKILKHKVSDGWLASTDNHKYMIIYWYIFIVFFSWLKYKMLATSGSHDVRKLPLIFFK